jgi:hypothetical protein
MGLDRGMRHRVLPWVIHEWDVRVRWACQCPVRFCAIMGQDVPVERDREQEWRRESSLDFKWGQMNGSAIPNMATTTAITPTTASTDRLCDWMIERLMRSRCIGISIGRAHIIPKQYAKLTKRSWTSMLSKSESLIKVLRQSLISFVSRREKSSMR